LREESFAGRKFRGYFFVKNRENREIKYSQKFVPLKVIKHKKIQKNYTNIEIKIKIKNLN